MLVESTTDHILRTSYRRHMEPQVRLRVEKLDETVRKFMLQLTAERFLEWQEHTEEGDSYIQLLERVFDQYGEKKAFRKVKEEVVTLINAKPAKGSAHHLKNRLKDLLAHSEEFLKLYIFMEEYSRGKALAVGRKSVTTVENSQMTELVRRVSDQIFEKFYLQIERGHIMAKVKEYLDRAIVYDGDGAGRSIWNIAEIRKNVRTDGFLGALEEYAREELKVFTERLTYDEIYSDRSELVKIGDLSYRITQHLMKGHAQEISEFVKTQYVSELLHHLSEQHSMQNEKLRMEIVQKLDEYLRKDRRVQMELKQHKTIKTADIVERYLEHVFGEQWEAGGKQAGAAGIGIWPEEFGRHAVEEFTSDAAQVIYMQVLGRNEIEEYVRSIEEIDVEGRIGKMTKALLRDGQMLKQATGRTYLESLPGTFTELADYYKSKYEGGPSVKQENLLKLLISKQENYSSHADLQKISIGQKAYGESQDQFHERELTDRIIYRVLQTKLEEKDTAWQQEMFRTLLSEIEWKDELQENSLQTNQTNEENVFWSLDVKLIPKLIAAQEEYPLQEQAVTVHSLRRGASMQDIIKRQLQSSSERIQRSIQMVHERKLTSHAPEQVKDTSYVSLEYMEEYFDHSKSAGEIQFALPVTKQETQVPAQLEEKMSEIHRQIDHLSQQVEQVRNETQNVSQSFVSKSEMEYMRKKLVSDMEEDILVAKRRHGGF